MKLATFQRLPQGLLPQLNFTLCSPRRTDEVCSILVPNLESIREHYEKALRTPGDSGKRVGWRDTTAQMTRFNCIFQLLTGYEPRSVADIGCGTADFLSFLRAQGWAGAYIGTDISQAMIQEASRRFAGDAHSKFIVTDSPPQADVVVASGIFNVSLNSDATIWKEYCEDSIRRMWQSAGQGIVFNMLSTDSDPDKRNLDLSYFDPSDWLCFVRKQLSMHVRIDQTYGQFDFTVAVFRSAIVTSKIESLI